MENLGEKIKNGLYKKRIKQVDLAKKLGKSPQQITDWIKGRSKPQVEDFLKLAETLDLVEDLFPSYKKVIPKESSIESRLDMVEALVYDMAKKLNMHGIAQTYNNQQNGMV